MRIGAETKLHQRWLSTAARSSRRRCYYQKIWTNAGRMSKEWLQERAEELKLAAERRDTKRFYELKESCTSTQAMLPLLSSTRRKAEWIS